MIKVRNSSSVWVQIMKMSSMKRHQVCGWCSACESASVSNLAKNRLAYDGAMRVPCVEGVVEFKTVHSMDHPGEVAESLSA